MCCSQYILWHAVARLLHHEPELAGEYAFERRGSERPVVASRQKRVRIIAGQRLARTGIRMAKIAVHVFVAPAISALSPAMPAKPMPADDRPAAASARGRTVRPACGNRLLLPCIHLDELGNQLVALRLRLRLRRLRRCLVFDHLATFSRTAQTFTAAPSAFSRHRYLALSLFRLASRTG